MPKMTRRFAVLSAAAASAVLSIATLSTAAFADQIVQVTLWDKGPDSITLDDAHPMGLGSNADMSMAMAMAGVKADVTTVAAGTVTFQVTNGSKDIVHEMILSPAPAEGQVFPYLADEYRVDEDAAGHLGEVSELDPGATGALTIDLKPGKYVLFCNLPAHFMNGMWVEITVK